MYPAGAVESLINTLRLPCQVMRQGDQYVHVSAVMSAAGIEEGPHRCPKGLRHGYAIHALSKAVPLNLVSKWMGHAKMETTAIYANAVGEEQQNIAARMWT